MDNAEISCCGQKNRPNITARIYLAGLPFAQSDTEELNYPLPEIGRHSVL